MSVYIKHMNSLPCTKDLASSQGFDVGILYCYKTNIVAKSCAHSAEEITESAWEFQSPMFGGGGGSLNPVHKRGGGGGGGGGEGR